MKKSPIILGTALMLFLSCEQKHQEATTEETAAAESAKYMSSSAAVEGKNQPDRKFIRTADLKFKVKDVVQSTYAVEDACARHGGFVTYTNLTSTTDEVNTVQVSRDSSMVTTHFTVTNSIVIRVPNYSLDTTLKEIATQVEHFDYRTIKADDVSLQMLSNDLAQKRAVKKGDRMTDNIDKLGRKLGETGKAEETVTSAQEDADNAKIANLALDDKVKYSTVSIDLYQRQSHRSEMIPLEPVVTPYEPHLGLKLMSSFAVGWNILETLIVFMAKFWALFAVAIGLFLLNRKYNLLPR